MRRCGRGKIFPPLVQECWAIMCIDFPTKAANEHSAPFANVPMPDQRRCRWKIM